MSTVFASMCRLVKSVLIAGILALVVVDFATYAPSAGGWGVGGAGFTTLVLPGTQSLAAMAAPVMQAEQGLEAMDQAMQSVQF